MTVLRVYDPHECDEAGVPLDWEQCRTCGGSAKVGLSGSRSCESCAGNGSLKAAALAFIQDEERWQDRPDGQPRCQDCGHPMSDGTWDWSSAGRGEPILGAELDDYAERALRDGAEPSPLLGVHYSPCDEGCRHDRVCGRVESMRRNGTWSPAPTYPVEWAGTRPSVRFAASWRPVDVRTLAWPHDLRPEKLAVLCLRCGAARST